MVERVIKRTHRTAKTLRHPIKRASRKGRWKCADASGVLPGRLLDELMLLLTFVPVVGTTGYHPSCLRHEHRPSNLAGMDR